MDLVINCPCSNDGCGGFGLIVAANADLNAWRQVAANITGLECPGCGCTQNLNDGGHCIAQIDKSMPKIDSVSPIQGFSSTTATIRGHRLDYGTLVVKFGEAAATILTRTENLITVVVPANAQGQAYDVSVENENGRRLNGGTLKTAFYYLA